MSCSSVIGSWSHLKIGKREGTPSRAVNPTDKHTLKHTEASISTDMHVFRHRVSYGAPTVAMSLYLKSLQLKIYSQPEPPVYLTHHVL